MKKILISLSIIAAAAAIAIGATTAFFSDTETSTGNTFTAGALDLKVDNHCIYNGETCPTPENMLTSWEPADLGAQHKFFYFGDVKPGDWGEDTVSLYVDNDAWVRLLINDVTSNDNDCTEPEGVEEGGILTPGCDSDGELQENLLFTMWLDWGFTPGYQGTEDPGEGDNEQNYNEPTLINEGTVENGEVWDLADFDDMYLAGDQTAYFGIAWRLPETVVNDVQTDSMSATMEIQVEQYRNNLEPWL